MVHFDIVHAADPRFRGGTASAIRTEIIAADRWNLKAALLPYHGMQTRPGLGFAPRIQSTIAELGFPMLSYDDPATCEILFAHHPYVFKNLPLQKPRLKPRKVVAVLHHPPLDGNHRLDYEPEAIISTLEATYQTDVLLAPVGPVVRKQLVILGVDPETILPSDFLNIVDETEWPQRTRPVPTEHAVIGRHSRDDPLKWPESIEDIFAAYPTTPNITVRMLGRPYLPKGVAWPRNWHAREFTATGMADFLSNLDFYVYFHSNRWVEAFGLANAEAMASGLVTILPPHFEELFGEGAVYGQPSDVGGLVEKFLSQPDEYRRQGQAARHVVHEKFSIKRYNLRLQNLAEELGVAIPGPLRPKSVPVQAETTEPKLPNFPPGPARTRLLMVATNGIGLGHVTRLMAIAKHLPGWIEPVFLTLSLATDIVRKQGYSADYIPSFAKNSVTEDSWNDIFAQELLAALDATGAQGVVFDSNHPFPGLLTVLNLRPDLSWIWVRRGLWQPHHKLSHEVERSFDLVLEPGELAHSQDHGPTANMRGAIPLSPVLLVEPDETLDRTQAASELNLDPKAVNVALQLGSRQNSDIENLRRRIAETLKASDVNAFEIVNPLAPPDDGIGLKQHHIYPVARYSKAIDLLITTAGYNGFHESMYHGIPTVFVPNEAPEMDHQLLRAQYAQICGRGKLLRNADAARADTIVTECLSKAFRDATTKAANDLAYTSGGREAAVAIAEQLASVRSNRPLALALPKTI